MDISQALTVRPQANKLFGITHDAVTGAPVVRVPRSCKISIGVPKGPDIEVYKDFPSREHPNGSWVIMVGTTGKRYTTKLDAMNAWPALKAQAPKRDYPKKLPYFTFSYPTHDGFEPAWDYIDLHGPKPAELDVVFTEAEPYHGGYEMWTASELKCYGDGITAWRVNSMAKTPEEKELAQAAASAGEKYFPVTFIGGCAVGGCEFYANKKCKPSVRLQFQCLAAPRLGSTAYFHTTSIKSAIQLHSCLHTFKVMTGRGNADAGFVSGIPLKMVLRPFKVNPVNQRGEKVAGTAYSVLLELRAESVADFQQKMLAAGRAYQQQLEPAPPKQIVAPESLEVVDAVVDADHVEDDETYEEASPAAVAAEFYHEADDEEFNEPTGKPAPKDDGRGTVEAAQEVAQQKLAAMEQKVTPADIANVEPEPKEPVIQDVEPAITEDQLMTLLTLAGDKKISEKELRQIAIGIGGPWDGHIASMPARMYADVLRDLQSDNKPRPVEEPKDKGQRRLNLGRRS